VVADRVEANALARVVNAGEPIPANMMALDIGPQTIESFSEEVSRARTIVWNGPMGVFELPPFAKGTFKIAQAVAENAGATSIVGGGDSVAAVKAAGVADKITHISTGAEPRSNSWKARNYREWKRSATSSRALRWTLRGHNSWNPGIIRAQKKLIAANWKMYKTPDQAREFFRDFLPLVQGHDRDEIVVCPTFLAIDAGVKATSGTSIAVGAQDVHWEKEGAFTGESMPRCWWR